MPSCCSCYNNSTSRAVPRPVSPTFLCFLFLRHSQVFRKKRKEEEEQEQEERREGQKSGAFLLLSTTTFFLPSFSLLSFFFVQESEPACFLFYFWVDVEAERCCWPAPSLPPCLALAGLGCSFFFSPARLIIPSFILIIESPQDQVGRASWSFYYYLLEWILLIPMLRLRSPSFPFPPPFQLVSM